ncbi:hypothetical protein Hanom_Chr13g01206931 [Helianthus anomalus]
MTCCNFPREFYSIPPILSLYLYSDFLHIDDSTPSNLQEICSFDNADIAALKASGAFPAGAVIRPFDREVRSDVDSDVWVCFLAYPFLTGLRYPFPTFISRFFELTGLSYAQTMPMVWRVLVTLD